jgi:hypothetical protein
MEELKEEAWKTHWLDICEILEMEKDQFDPTIVCNFDFYEKLKILVFGLSNGEVTISHYQ